MNWLTIKQAADEMQVSTGTIRAMIESGRLKATLVGSGAVRKTYRIPVDSLVNIQDVTDGTKLVREKPVAHKLHPAIAKAIGV